MNQAVRRRKDITIDDDDAYHKYNKKGARGSGATCPGWILRGGLVTICLLAVYLAYAYATSPVEAVAVDDFPDLTGLSWPFKTNKLLQNGKKLHHELEGAESIAYDDNGHLYTGLQDGRIVRIRKTQGGGYSDVVETVTDTKQFIESIGEKERTRMRPLGLRYQGGKIYIADPYQGILVYDIAAKKGGRLVKYDAVSPPMKFTDDLTITKDGNMIYFTDGSSRWHYHQSAYSTVEGECSGRLFGFDMKTREVGTILRGLCFANGVQLSVDETQILLAETHRCRVHVIDVVTHRLTKTTILPGGPDNIRPSSTGGYWIAVPMLHDTTMDILHDYPVIRSLLAGVFGEKGLFIFANLSRGVAIRLNKDGHVLDVLYDMDGALSRAVTQVTELQNGELLLGSFYAHGIIQIEKPRTRYA